MDIMFVEVSLNGNQLESFNLEINAVGVYNYSYE